MVACGYEPGLARHAVEPIVEVALTHFDNVVAALADEVVVMAVTAEPVALLTSVV